MIELAPKLMVFPLRAFLVCLVLAAWPSDSRAADDEPLRVEIRPLAKQAAVGESIEYEVVLKNAHGGPSKAWKPMELSVEIHGQDGRVDVSKITIPAGADSATADFRVRVPGLTSIQVSHPELMDGGSAVMGVNPRALRTKSLDGRVRPNADSPALGGAMFSDRSRSILPAPAAPPPAAATGSGGGQGDVGATDPAPSVPSDTRELALAAPVNEPLFGDVSLRVQDRPILADGVDGVAVDVYLNLDRPARDEVAVLLSVTRGALNPRRVVFAPGEFIASTRWVSSPGSSGVGVVAIERSSPRLDRGDPVTRNFAPPIHALELRANPPEITLLDKGGLVAELRDTVNNVPVATDRELKLTLAIREGSGAIEPVDVVFKKGESSTRADFRPKELGRVVVVGHIPQRAERVVEITVAFAVVAFATGIFGGAVGGGLSWLTQKQRWWRIPVGVVTGAALFLTLLFLGADAFLEKSVNFELLNPYVVFVVTLMGGWAGTAVLNRLLGKFGVKA